MFPADTAERIIWLGGLWILMTVAWAAACMWVEQDAQTIFGKSMPWSLGFAAGGAVFFLTSYLWGFATLPIFTILLPACLQGYIVARDRKAPQSDRMMTRQFAERTMLTVAEKIGARDAVAGWFKQQEVAKQVPPPVQFVKKDGTPIDSQGGKNLDKDTSRAVKNLEEIFAKAIDMRATDVHFDPKESGEMQVRCRVDGIMGILASFEGTDARGLVSALKVKIGRAHV
mgnify:FL=1